MEQRIEDTTTQATYAQDITRMIEKLPESPAAKKLLRRVWKLLLHFMGAM